MKYKYEVRVWEKPKSYENNQSESDYQFSSIREARKFLLELKRDRADAYHLGYSTDDDGNGWEFIEGWVNR